VMYSSDASDKTKLAALMAGATAYVAKVVKDVAGTLQSIIEKHAYTGEKPDRIPTLLKESDPLIEWGGIQGMLEDI
jgi:hypothetical protein